MLSGLFGNATEINIDQLRKEFAPILAEGEQVEKAFRLIRDMFVFTNKRLILVDRQGMSGKKTEYHSIPYKSITHFLVETAGTFDRDSELKIWISSTSTPVSKQLKKGTDIIGIQRTLATYVLR